jgi:MFS transporter, DHA1 family, multidrug resistance protein
MVPSQRKNRYLFIVVSFLLWFPNFLYVPILSPYIDFLGGSYTFVGIILSSYGITQLLFRLPIGIFSDLVKKRKPFIVMGMLASALSCILFLMSEILWFMLLARALAGIAAATWVVFTVLFPTYYEEDKVHKAMSHITFIVVLGQLLGMSFSGIVVDEFGWKAPFILGVIFSIVGLFLSLFVHEQKGLVDKKPITFNELIFVVKDPLLLKTSFLSIVAHSMIFVTMFGFTSSYALEIGFQEKELTWIVIVFMIPHAFATLYMGSHIVPRLGEWNSLKLAFLTSSIFAIVIPLFQTKFAFLIIQGCFGFSLGLIFPLLLGMSIQNIEIEKRATAMGAYQALYAIGIFAGPFFAGILNSLLGLESGFYFVGILGIFALTFIFIWSRKQVMVVENNQFEEKVE